MTGRGGAGAGGALGIMVQQKQAMGPLQKCLAKLSKYDTTTVDFGELSGIAGEHTHRIAGECVVWHAKKCRDLGMP